jgi:hypothetical protein
MVLSEAIHDHGKYARQEAGYSESTYFGYLPWHRNDGRWLVGSESPVRPLAVVHDGGRLS